MILMSEFLKIVRRCFDVLFFGVDDENATARVGIVKILSWNCPLLNSVWSMMWDSSRGMMGRMQKSILRWPRPGAQQRPKSWRQLTEQHSWLTVWIRFTSTLSGHLVGILKSTQQKMPVWTWEYGIKHQRLTTIVSKSPSFNRWSNPTRCQSNFALGPLTRA